MLEKLESTAEVFEMHMKKVRTQATLNNLQFEAEIAEAMGNKADLELVEIGLKAADVAESVNNQETQKYSKDNTSTDLCNGEMNNQSSNIREADQTKESSISTDTPRAIKNDTHQNPLKSETEVEIECQYKTTSQIPNNTKENGCLVAETDTGENNLLPDHPLIIETRN